MSFFEFLISDERVRADPEFIQGVLNISAPKREPKSTLIRERRNEAV